MYGVMVILDKTKYQNWKAIFLHRANSIADILTYSDDVSTYFQFNTELEARQWFGEWYRSNSPMLHIPLNEYRFIPIQPGINTRGYLPGTDCKEEMRYEFID